MNERRIWSLGKNIYGSAALPDSPWSEMLMMYLIEAFDAKPIAGGEWTSSCTAPHCECLQRRERNLGACLLWYSALYWASFGIQSFGLSSFCSHSNVSLTKPFRQELKTKLKMGRFLAPPPLPPAPDFSSSLISVPCSSKAVSISWERNTHVHCQPTHLFQASA